MNEYLWMWILEGCLWQKLSKTVPKARYMSPVSSVFHTEESVWLSLTSKVTKDIQSRVFFSYSSIFAMPGLPTYIMNVLLVTLLPGSVGPVKNYAFMSIISVWAHKQLIGLRMIKAVIKLSGWVKSVTKMAKGCYWLNLLV